jgi:hypothetical protein
LVEYHIHNDRFHILFSYKTFYHAGEECLILDWFYLDHMKHSR